MFQSQLDELLGKGFTSIQFDDDAFIGSLSRNLAEVATKRFGKTIENLEFVHKEFGTHSINELRFDAVQAVNRDIKFRETLLDRACPFLTRALGPDLAVQKNMSLMISAPGDETSQIPLHADTWVGHSPFELNLWLPLTRVFKTQSMFILPLSKMLARKDEWDGRSGTINQLMDKWKGDLHFIDAKPGCAILFWHHLPHGNVINLESGTRWCVSLRFKNLFSPYGERGLGDYFVPWKYGPVTELALGNGKIWV
jgi:sporadic carbohydrate cluster 2OG-Fe(II) oxygenase